MPTVLDALVVSLGLDPSDFIQKSEAARADMKKTAAAGRSVADETEESFAKSSAASVKHSKELEAWGKNAAESLSKLRDTAIGLFAAFTGAKAFGQMVIDTTGTEASMGRLAKNLNIPVKTLGEWRLAMLQVGGTAEDATSSLQAMQNLQAESMFGNPQATRTMGILGIKAGEDPSQSLVAASKFFSTHDGLYDQQFAGMAGISTAMMNFLEQGPAAVQATLNALAKDAPTPGDVKDSTALQKQWGVFEATLSGIGNELTDVVNPMMQTFLGWLQKIADWGLQHPKEFGAAGAAGTVLSGAAGLKTLQWLSKAILGRGGAGAAAEAAEASAAADVVAAGGTVALSSVLAAALAALTVGAAATPTALDPGEEQELQRRGLGLGQAKPLAPDVESEVRFAASANGVDPNLAVALFRQEGGGYNNVSSAGAFGPAQLMPGTAGDLGVATSPDDPNYSWETNADAGVKYFGEMLARYHGDKVRALVAYNWGPGNADKWDGKIADLPLETQNYVARILKMSAPASAPKTQPGTALPSSVTNLLSALRSPPPSAAAAALMAHHGAMLAAAGASRHAVNNGPVNSHNNHSTAETHVHSIVVNTRATDGKGVARSLGDALKKNGLVAMGSNRGLA
jgi:soluble lytic murein transglycosylase-like protein